MYEVKDSQICKFWTFCPVIQLINHLFQSACPILKRWYNSRVLDQNIQKCCICLIKDLVHVRLNKRMWFMSLIKIIWSMYMLNHEDVVHICA